MNIHFMENKQAQVVFSLLFKYTTGPAIINLVTDT